MDGRAIFQYAHALSVMSESIRKIQEEGKTIMKLLSIAIPSYNSESYMRHAIETLLPGGDEVEILVVNDGSKDGTAAIADEYEKKYPGIVRALHKENGGHGDAVMTGLKAATGLYFKVVDSDDWVDADAYRQILDALRARTAPGQQVDLCISNYVYEKVGAAHKHVVRYTNALPVGKDFTWDEVGTFHIGQYILMHSAIYRRQMLIDCGLSLPKHTFYVDNLYVYIPMQYVEKMIYLDVDFYRYFIGRDDQSVQEQVMIKRIDQQLRVNDLMFSQVDLTKVNHPKKRAYMRNYLEIVTGVSMTLLCISATPEHLEKKKRLWKDAKEKYPHNYQFLRGRLIWVASKLPGAPGRAIVKFCYKVSQKIFGFN